MQSSPAGPSFPACSEEFEAAAEREVAELLRYAAAEGGEAADVRRGCGDGEAAGGGVKSAGPRRAAGPDLRRRPGGGGVESAAKYTRVR